MFKVECVQLADTNFKKQSQSNSNKNNGFFTANLEDRLLQTKHVMHCSNKSNDICIVRDEVEGSNLVR